MTGGSWYVICPEWHSPPMTEEKAKRACAQLNKTDAVCDHKHTVSQTLPTKKES